MKNNSYLGKWIKRATNASAMALCAGLMYGNFAARAASPSELLEKAVYSEESKGDLDAAMQLYEQVVKEAKDQQSVAAQAQYRLAVCYYKKKNYQKSNEAFEKLVKDYPDQKELVAKATEYLSGASSFLPAPWVDGETMRYELKMAGGVHVGVAAYSVESGQLAGKPIWRFATQLGAAGMQQISIMEASVDSLKPLHSRWKHTLLGDADTTYSGTTATIKLKGKEGAKMIDLKGVVYDNEEAVQLFRCLPLTTNYETPLTLLSSLAGGALVPLKVTIEGVESLTVPAGTMECYKAELSIHQTFWFSTDAHHYVVKFEAGGVVAELTSIKVAKANEPETITDSTYHYTLSAPKGWLFDRNEPDKSSGPTSIVVLDPDASGTVVFQMEKKENLKETSKVSLRAWADSKAGEAANTFKNFKVRPDSWFSAQLAGQPAIRFTADLSEQGKPKVANGLFAFDGPNAVSFISYAPAEEFDHLQKALASVIKSCTRK